MHPCVSTVVSTLDSTMIPLRRTLFSRIIPAASLVCFGSCLASAAMQPVTLRWNANPETDIVGYKVLIGTRSGSYDQSFTVENGTSLALPDLTPGTRYYSAVQAYNFAGLTSENSAEVEFATAALPPLTLRWNTNPETDLAGYKIHLGTRSGVYDQTYTVTNGTSLALTNLTPGKDYFCAVQAYNLTGVDSPLSSEIRFNSGSNTNVDSASTLQNWLAAYDTTGGATADPDGDGLNHLQEYAFGTDPTQSSSGPAGVSSNGKALRGTPTLTEEGAVFCRRINPSACGLAYLPQFSDDLQSWKTSTAPDSTLAQDNEIEVILIPLPQMTGGRQFFRLEIQHTP